MIDPRSKTELETNPQYVGYPRGEAPERYGSTDKLESLGKGYYGLSISKTSFAWLMIWMAEQDGHFVRLQEFYGAILAYSIIMGLATIWSYRKIAYGLNWSDRLAILPGVLMLMNLPFWLLVGNKQLWGEGGYTAVSTAVILFATVNVKKELKRYGVKVKANGQAAFKETVKKRRLVDEFPKDFSIAPTL